MSSSNLGTEIRQRIFNSPEHEAYLAIGRTWSSLEHEVSEVLKPFGISTTQYNVLRILRGAGDIGLCRADVMERLISRVPDATRLLDRMEAAGYLRRQRDESDRRFVTTKITRKGLNLLTKLDEPVESLHIRQLSSLSKGDLNQLILFLGQLRGEAEPTNEPDSHS